MQWGDSGVYICKVVISDDLEGQNEASVELLVLGKLILICHHVLTVKSNYSDNKKRTDFTFFLPGCWALIHKLFISIAEQYRLFIELIYNKK